MSLPPSAAVLALTLLAGAVQAPPDDSSGEPPAAPTARSVEREGGVSLDGRLDEAAWERAEAVTAFTQVDPDEGEPVSQRTEVRILHDAEALYVGARLWDDGPVTTRMGRRDMPLLDSDWFGVVIDSYHDHRTGFVFDVNPGGVKRDAVKSTGSNGNYSDDNAWDAVWEVATSVDEEGWTAEYRIPFSQLRFGNGGAPTWGIQLERVIGRNREYAVFSFTPKAERGGIAAYGHLEGLESVAAGERVEVLPYVVVRSEHVDPGPNPFRTDSERSATAGVNLLYRITSDFTLNATFNPDFGQVEVDPAVVNLGVYETFFQEKRPFFVEGSQIFDFGRGNAGGRLFYSRRLGRRPQLGAPGRRADVPGETTILGAGKISGQTRSGWSFGLLEAVTDREEARYMNDAEQVERAVVEPRTNYLVGRVRKDLREGRSTLGALVTAVNRSSGAARVDAALPASAYAAGVDLNHEFADREWALRGSFVGSRVAGSPEAILAVQRAPNHYFQRPDADHLEIADGATSLTGYTASLTLARQAGLHWLGELGGALTSPGYEVNDLGFSYRTDRRDVQANLRYRETRPGDFLRNWSAGLFTRNEFNHSGRRILAMYNLFLDFRHLDFWGGHLMLSHMARTLDDRSTRGGPMVVRPAATSAFLALSSDGRKAVTLNGNVRAGRTEFDGSELSGRVSLGLKPTPRWKLSVGPRVSLQEIPAQYVATVEDGFQPTFGSRYLFAPLARTEVGLETRLDYTFTPKLTLEMYVQPLISTGDYGTVRFLEEPASFAFAEYAEEVTDPDFNLRSLRGNAVLRWEWRPGSTLYVAWQQTRSDYAALGDFDFSRDGRALFGSAPDDIFLVKMNYWFTP